MFSGLNTDHFVTKSSVQIIEKEGLEALSNAIAIIGLAEAEGLSAHANAVRVRGG